MRKLMMFALPFGAGAFLCQYCLPQMWGFWLIPAVLLLGAAVWKLAEEIRLQTVLVTVGLAAGLFWFSLYSLWYLVPNDRLAGTEEPVSMTLLEYARETDYGARVTVKVDARRGRAVFYGDAGLLTLEQVMAGDKKPADKKRAPQGATGNPGQAELDAIAKLLKED